MKLIIFLISLIAGMGVYIIFQTLFADQLGTRRKLSLDAGADNRRKSLQQKLGNFIKALLIQSQAQISPSEFIFTSLGIGLALGTITYLLTGAILLASTGLLLGGTIYYYLLLERRDKFAGEYEQVQAQVAYLLANSFVSEGLNLDAVLETVIDNGPALVRVDWRLIRAAFSTSRIDQEAINNLISRRNSPGFSKLCEALLLYRNDLERMPKIMVDLHQDIVAESRLYAQVRSKLLEPKRNLALISVLPPIFHLILISTAEPIRSFYATPMGQIVTLVLFAYVAFIYIFGTRKAQQMIQLRPISAQLTEKREPVQDKSNLEFSSTQPGSSFKEEEEIIRQQTGMKNKKPWERD